MTNDRIRIARRTLLNAAGLSLAGVTLGCEDSDFPLSYERGTRVYPARMSLLPGEVLCLHISSPAPQIRIDLYRQGVREELVFRSDWMSAAESRMMRPDVDWEFPAYRVPLSLGLRPGVYIARVVEGANGLPLELMSPAATHGKSQAVFIVKTPVAWRGALLYKLGFSTYHAYNFTGGGSLYHVAEDDAGRPLFDLGQRSPDGPRGTKLTLLRPGGGTGADTTEPVDYYDPRSVRNTFEHWDAHFISWLESQHIAVDYCTGLDLHQDPDLLASYRGLVCAGHDEYWSEPERDQIESFMATGGNVAFFCGNTCWWRIHYVDDDTAIVCDKRGHSTNDQWFNVRPENSLTGVSYRFGGGRWKGARPAIGYTVQHPEHWVFAGTGLSQGDVFGADPAQPLVGYECDSAPYHRDPSGIAVPREPKAFGTPEDFTILGVAELNGAWSTTRGHSATMGSFGMPGGGQIFNAATTDWVKRVERDPYVAQITRNVLGRFANG